MKNSLYFFGWLMALGTTACQQPVAKQAEADVGVTETAAPVRVAAKAVTPAASPVLTAEMDTFLQTYNLAELWRPADDALIRSMDGFLGADHHRVEIVLLSVQKDTLQPAVYHVSGQDRFRGRVTPFSGTITVQGVQDLGVDVREFMDEKSNAKGYTATGTYVFNEDSASKGAGTFTGKVAVDFTLDPNLADGLALFGLTIPATAASPTRGTGSLFEGTWRSYQTNEQKPTTWAYNFLSVASEVLQDFNIGERDVTINPKYAKLGWDEYWTNEEWWAETGTATASASSAAR
jgi:hypothetical protein